MACLRESAELSRAGCLAPESRKESYEESSFVLAKLLVWLPVAIERGFLRQLF